MNMKSNSRTAASGHALTQHEFKCIWPILENGMIQWELAQDASVSRDAWMKPAPNLSIPLRTEIRDIVRRYPTIRQWLDQGATIDQARDLWSRSDYAERAEGDPRFPVLMTLLDQMKETART